MKGAKMVKDEQTGDCELRKEEGSKFGDSNGLVKVEQKIHNEEIFAKVAPAKELKKHGLIRHIVAVLALSSIIMANMNRQAFNQALVSMTKPKQVLVPEKLVETLNQTTGPLDESTESTTQMPAVGAIKFDDRFDWTSEQIGVLQSAFSYGYMPFMIVGGRMSEIYGAKWIVFLSGFGSAMCCLLSPFFADTNYYLLVLTRVVMGLCQTGVSPALFALLTRWLPPIEASVYLPMIKVGVMLGFMSGSLVSGFFTWRTTFYIISAIGLVWTAIWVVFVTSDPSDHKMVNDRELGYIKQEITKLNKGRKQSTGSSRKATAPWVRIITNPMVLLLMLTKLSAKLSTDSQSMQFPLYLRNVFHISKELNGILSAINFAIQGLLTGFVAWAAKECVAREIFGLDKTGVRKIFQGTASIGAGLAYILITCNMGSLTVVCSAMVLLSLFSMFGAGGESVLPVDLSLEYSASIMAISNSTANLSGIILPQIVAFIMGDQQESSDHWNRVWFFIGGFSLFSGIVFITRLRAEIQDFSKKPSGMFGKLDVPPEAPIILIEMRKIESE